MEISIHVNGAGWCLNYYILCMAFWIYKGRS